MGKNFLLPLKREKVPEGRMRAHHLAPNAFYDSSRSLTRPPATLSRLSGRGKTGGVVLAMGTFDGVHRGHRAVVKKAVGRARRLGLPAMVMTFRRPLRFFFRPPSGPALLTTPEETDLLLHDLGPARVEFLEFGKKLASQPAEDFFRKRVVGRWIAREIVVGYNFAFGRGREGDPRFLKAAGEKAGVRVHVVPRVSWKGRPVSSGLIRD